MRGQDRSSIDALLISQGAEPHLIQEQGKEANNTSKGMEINGWRKSFLICGNPVEKEVVNVPIFLIPL